MIEQIRLLSKQNFFIYPHFLSDTELKEVRSELDFLYSKGAFRRAGIGNKNNFQINDHIRSDEIHWWEFNNLSSTQKIISKKFEEIKKLINQELYLGIWDFEGHYAVYPQNSFYEKHVDCFHDDDKRKISFVLFLNLNWQKGDGGELKIYLDNKILKIDPIGGTLVCFLSRKTFHEVLVTNRLRKTFTGWFKIRTI